MLLFLERSAEVFREKPAVIYRRTSYTYPQLRARVRRLASALARAGIQKGDRVAVLCPNIPPMLEAHYGINLAGAIMVPGIIGAMPTSTPVCLNQAWSVTSE